MKQSQKKCHLEEINIKISDIKEQLRLLYIERAGMEHSLDYVYCPNCGELPVSRDDAARGNWCENCAIDLGW